jgi:hypothetical protein
LGGVVEQMTSFGARREVVSRQLVSEPIRLCGQRQTQVDSYIDIDMYLGLTTGDLQSTWFGIHDWNPLELTELGTEKKG